MKTKNTELKEENAFRKASLKAKKLREFYSHLRTYFIINALFFIINLISYEGEWWVLYPIVGWGFCLTLHAIDVLNPFKNYDDEWEEKKTNELVEKYNDKRYETRRNF